MKAVIEVDPALRSERHHFCHSIPFQCICLQTGKSSGFG